jgi:hypothetical protein
MKFWFKVNILAIFDFYLIYRIFRDQKMAKFRVESRSLDARFEV